MKKLLTVACVVFAAAFANASELWWTVNTTDVGAGEWDTAKLYATSSGLNFGETTPIASISADWMSAAGKAVTDIEGYMTSGTSFYVELWKGDEWVATSYTGMMGDKGVGTVGLGALAGSIRDGMGTVASPYSYSQFSTDIVPEPTSGLMILLGLAALGLKRKRA